MKVTRLFYQIYTELEDIKFNGRTKTIYTLRASILNALAKANLKLREYEPLRKDRYGTFEDAIRTLDPESEIKIGVVEDLKVFFQVSVSQKTNLEPIHTIVLNALKDFFNIKEAKEE